MASELSQNGSTTTSCKRRISTVKTRWKNLFTLRSIIAVALMFWCAGTGCMIVAYARGAMSEMDASAQSAEQPMAGMSASMDAHACCKARHASSKQSAKATNASDPGLVQTTLPLSPSSDAMSCCPLTSGSMVIASRSQSTDQKSVLNQRDSSSLQLTKTKSPTVAVRLKPPNQARAYLLDCAFLI